MSSVCVLVLHMRNTILRFHVPSDMTFDFLLEIPISIHCIVRFGTNLFINSTYVKKWWFAWARRGRGGASTFKVRRAMVRMNFRLR